MFILIWNSSKKCGKHEMKKIKQKPFIQAVQQCMGDCDQHMINLKKISIESTNLHHHIF